MEAITSKSNLKVKKAMSLHTKKGRDKAGLFIIEGLRFVFDAFLRIEPLGFEYVIYSTEGISKENALEIEELVAKLSASNVKCYMTSRTIIQGLSDTETPQGIVAILKKTSLPNGVDPEEVPNGNCRIIILDKVRDPGNLGTIIRTADSAGFDGVMLMKGTVDFLSPKVLRATMGSAFNIPVWEGMEISHVETLKNKGIKLVSATLDGAVNYLEEDFGERFAIIIGNEGFGVSKEIIDISHSKVKIPIFGKAESLNAAVAAGILMYKARE